MVSYCVTGCHVNLTLAGTCSAFGSHISLDSAGSMSRAGSFPLLTLSDGTKKEFRMSFNDADMSDMNNLFKVSKKVTNTIEYSCIIFIVLQYISIRKCIIVEDIYFSSLSNQ